MSALWLFMGIASAQEPRSDQLLIGGRVLAEVWQDANIATVYRSTGLAAAGTFSWRPHAWLSVDGELSIIRLTGEAEQSLQLVPLSVDVCVRQERDDFELFAGLGPALVPFVDEGNTVIPGSKIGLDLVAGARLATDLIDPPMTSTSPVQRADVELFIGRRQHFPGETGLDLSAWRVGAGLVVRL